MTHEYIIHRMKYLIVEDNENMRTMIRQSVCNHQDIVIECAGAEAAVEVYRTLRPDIVLMDIQLPGMDGIRATRELRSQFSNANVIIVTDYDTPSFRTAAQKAGALGLVSKENLSGIRKLIEQWLASARSSVGC